MTALKKRKVEFPAVVSAALVVLAALIITAIYAPSFVGFAILRPSAQTCVAEDTPAANGSFAGACDGVYPAECGAAGDLLSCNDGNVEIHEVSTAGYAGVKVEQFNASVTDCLSVTNVTFCYEWWTVPAADITDCDISVDNDNGTSFNEVTATCPGDAANPGVTCVDALGFDDWNCANFFGASGVRAQIKSEATRAVGLGAKDVSWDVLFFNVTYDAGTFISSCQTLDAPGKYQLNQSVSSARTCFNVTADHVLLDCAGFTITYATTTVGYAFNATGRNNVTLRNCNITQGDIAIADAPEILFSGTINSFILNNTINAIGMGTQGINLLSSTGNRIVNNTIMSGNNISVFISGGANNTFSGNTISTNTGTALSFASTAQNNTFFNNIIHTNVTWIKTDADSEMNNITEMTFQGNNASVLTINTTTIPVSTSVNLSNFNLSFNRVFLNTSQINFLNKSARILLREITFTNPGPLVDFEDDGTFVACDPPQCVEESFAGGVFVFNVSSFTMYSSGGGNSPPLIQRVVLNSTSGQGAAQNRSGTDENLTVVVFNATDVNGDYVTNITDWREYDGGVAKSIAVLNIPFETNVNTTGTGAIRDYSTFANNGTLGNGTAGSEPIWNLSSPVDGGVGGGYILDGSDIIIVNDSASLRLTTNFSIELWLKPSGTTAPLGNAAGILSNAINNGGTGVVVEESGVGDITLFIDNTGAGIGAPPAGVFVHFVGTYDGSNIRAYRNGVLNQTTAKAGDATVTNEPIFIGARSGGAGRFFNGTIGEVRIYNRSLSAAQVYQLYLDGNMSKHMETLVAGETEIGDIWQVAVTPNDNQPSTDGTTVLSNNVTIADVAVPSVTGLVPVAGSSFTVDQIIVIGANATDDLGVDDVLANVTLPNGTVQQLVLTNSSGTFNTSFTLLPTAGTYNVTFIANDTAGNTNSTERTSFTATEAVQVPQGGGGGAAGTVPGPGDVCPNGCSPIGSTECHGVDLYTCTQINGCAEFVLTEQQAAQCQLFPYVPPEQLPESLPEAPVQPPSTEELEDIKTTFMAAPADVDTPLPEQLAREAYEARPVRGVTLSLTNNGDEPIYNVVPKIESKPVDYLPAYWGRIVEPRAGPLRVTGHAVDPQALEATLLNPVVIGRLEPGETRQLTMDVQLPVTPAEKVVFDVVYTTFGQEIAREGVSVDLVPKVAATAVHTNGDNTFDIYMVLSGWGTGESEHLRPTGAAVGSLLRQDLTFEMNVKKDALPGYRPTLGIRGLFEAFVRGPHSAFSELFGPYPVREGDRVLLAQQFSYESWFADNYTIGFDVRFGSDLVAHQQHNITLKNDELGGE